MVSYYHLTFPAFRRHTWPNVVNRADILMNDWVFGVPLYFVQMDGGRSAAAGQGVGALFWQGVGGQGVGALFLNFGDPGKSLFLVFSVVDRFT